MTHTLKCRSDFFNDIWRLQKTFELRRDDRNFQVGDWVLLREIKIGIGYTGRKINARIRYVLRNAEEFGLQPGHCIFGMELIQNFRGIAWK